jgi:putative sterol carrier protein
MATLEECRQAINQLAARLSTSADGGGLRDFDRTLACRISDLNTAFHGRLAGGHVRDLAEGDDPNAKIKLTIGSDDLVDLVGGRLDAKRAFASGRLKINASVFDLLKLQKML